MMVYKSYDVNNNIESTYRIVYDTNDLKVYLESHQGRFIATDKLIEYVSGDTILHTHEFIDSVYFLDT